MSVTVDRATGRRAPSGISGRLRMAFGDGLLVARRNLVTLTRVPTVFIFELVQPIMFVLLFRFIYANQFAHLPPGVKYVQFLMPGIFIQNALFGSTQTAIGLAEDMKTGIIDRFRSLPMSRSAVLAGRTTSDLIKNFLLLMIVIAIGYLVGFRFQNGLINAIGVVVLVLAVGFTFSWISACIGLSLKKVEAVQAASFTWIFPVVFVSSAFVPVAGMAGFLQVVARNNPVTIWCNLARYLANGLPGITDLSTGRRRRHVHEPVGQVRPLDRGVARDLRAARHPPVPQADVSGIAYPGLGTCRYLLHGHARGRVRRLRRDQPVGRPLVLALPGAALRSLDRTGIDTGPRTPPRPADRDRLAVRPPKDPPAGTDLSYPWFP